MVAERLNAVLWLQSRGRWWWWKREVLVVKGVDFLLVGAGADEGGVDQVVMGGADVVGGRVRAMRGILGLL